MLESNYQVWKDSGGIMQASSTDYRAGKSSTHSHMTYTHMSHLYSPNTERHNLCKPSLNQSSKYDSDTSPNTVRYECIR
jgi:hypothetical protein